MADTLSISVKSAELGRLAADVERWAVQALAEAVRPVLAQVRDFTPRWKGGLVRTAATRAEEGGRVQECFMPPNVVALVHEYNGKWSRMPPRAPILAWVQGKLGLSGDDAERATMGIRRKILRRGLTLPNKEGRGKMFQRTFDLFQKTGAHYAAFRAALAQNIGRKGA